MLDLVSETDLRNQILSQYNLKDAKIFEVKFKNTDKQRAVYKIESNNKNYSLKKIYYELDELFFVYSSMEWLYRFNFNVPRILSTTSNKKYVTFNNMHFILTPWITGEKCNYDNYAHTISAANSLSKLHILCRHFRPIAGSKLRIGYENLYTEINKHFQQLLIYYNMAINENDTFSNFYVDNFDSYITLARLSLESASLINFSHLSKSLCHLDYVNKNIIFDDNNRLWLIDFDKCKMDYCIHDVAYFLRRIMKRERTNWNLKLLFQCLSTYEKHMPLNIYEYWYLHSYLSFPQKEWRLVRDYYNNINNCNKVSFLNLLKHSTNNIENHIKASMELKKYILSM